LIIENYYIKSFLLIKYTTNINNNNKAKVNSLPKKEHA